MLLNKEIFGQDFQWGVSTSAYQIEGAVVKHGKGESIWDSFVKKRGNVKRNETAVNSCMFYENYAKDITLMAHLNIPNYRFSISWSRIFPDGVGKVNKHGIDFYNRVIDLCLELNIEPWITLYHWDLPLELEIKGGWTNREIINWFSTYVECCLKNFGKKVKRWIILNEPMVFTGAGYFLGIHAPGKKGLNNFLAAAHHAALCQAEGGRIVKSFDTNFKVGTSISCSLIESVSNDERDIKASIRMDALLNRFFIEPLLGLEYPKELSIINKMQDYMKDGDEGRLEFEMDFIGIQNYTREIVKYNSIIPFLNASIITAKKRKVKSTLMNWEVYPPSIYEMLKKYNSYKNIKELIITENGAAFPDFLIDGEINDVERVQFLKDHIDQIYKAKMDGINVKGYFVWSFMDNFEWAEGYRPRFGLVHVDFKDQKRVIKASGQWYSKFLSSA